MPELEINYLLFTVYSTYDTDCDWAHVSNLHTQVTYTQVIHFSDAPLAGKN